MDVSQKSCQSVNSGSTRATGRMTYLDSAGGILLIYMIIYHCAQYSGYGSPFIDSTVFLGFFMQWFFFKAGMFFKPQRVGDVIKKSVSRLLVPWLVFNVIGMVVYTLQQYVHGEVISLHFVVSNIRTLVITGSSQGNPPLWFLLSLFGVRIVYSVIHATKGYWIYLALICIVPIAVYYLLKSDLPVYVSSNIPYYVSNIPIGVFFYALGDRLRAFKPGMGFTMLMLAVYVALNLLLPTYVFVFNNLLLKGVYLLSPVYSLFGIIIINALTLRFADRANVFSMIGADTMPFYCLHWIVILAVSLFFGAQPYDSAGHISYFLSLLAANAVLLPLLTFVIKKAGLKSVFG